MELRFYNIIPKKFRAKGAWVSLTIFVRAMLNFVGIAALLPLLYLILDANNIASNKALNYLYELGGFQSYEGFVIAVAVGVLLFIVCKSLVNIVLYRVERDYIYNLYRHLSRKLFTNCKPLAK